MPFYVMLHAEHYLYFIIRKSMYFTKDVKTEKELELDILHA